MLEFQSTRCFWDGRGAVNLEAMRHGRIVIIIGLCALAIGLPFAVNVTGTLASSGPALPRRVLQSGRLSKEVREERAFCTAPGPRNYAEPLAKLPQIKKLPAKTKDLAHLPFGPKSLAIYTWDPSTVLVNGGLYAIGFYDEDLSRELLSLNWTISAQVRSLTGSGVVRDTTDETMIEIGSFNDARQPLLELQIPEAAGFYRIDMQFATKAGELLGSYSEYLRVVRPTIYVRLGMSRRHFRHNQMVAFRMENVGTARVGYGGDYWVARATPTGWKGIDQLNHRSMLNYYSYVDAGQAGRCNVFRIPADLPQGLYRVSKSAGVTKDGKNFKGLRPSAEFWVTDPPPR